MVRRRPRGLDQGLFCGWAGWMVPVTLVSHRWHLDRTFSWLRVGSQEPASPVHPLSLLLIRNPLPRGSQLGAAPKEARGLVFPLTAALTKQPCRALVAPSLPPPASEAPFEA